MPFTTLDSEITLGNSTAFQCRHRFTKVHIQFVDNEAIGPGLPVRFGQSSRLFFKKPLRDSEQHPRRRANLRLSTSIQSLPFRASEYGPRSLAVRRLI